MAERGQITGGILDGPLAFDNAVSEEAAKIKGIVSSVAGRADIFIAPDLEAGNMLAKQLEYLAGAQLAGTVFGFASANRPDQPSRQEPGKAGVVQSLSCSCEKIQENGSRAKLSPRRWLWLEMCR